MLTIFILACAVIWHVGSHLVSGSGVPVPEDMATARYMRNAPSATQISYEYEHYEPYVPAQQVFTFAELAALSNDHLLLVNPDYGVPRHLSFDLVRLGSHVNSLNPDMMLNEHALSALRAMFDSAAGIGHTQFRVTQAFRTHEYQQSLYDQFAGTGLAATPGHSEHQVGLAVDISYHGVNIGNSVQGDWLMSYSYRYGFILRYPEHKTHITGVPFEPWHYRYVGQPHSYFMTHNDMVMEEYIAYLRLSCELRVSVDGVDFAVFYLDNPEGVLEIPYGRRFWTSLDNTGGVIVTVNNSH